MGSAARIYSALASEEPEIDTFEDCREDFSDFLDSSHEPGLTKAILYTFPELERLADLASLMQLAEAKLFSEAVTSFSTSYVDLGKQCKCGCCDKDRMNEKASAKCDYIYLSSIYPLPYCSRKKLDLATYHRSVVCVTFMTIRHGTTQNNP